jgi:hypothetical protein
MPSYNESTRGRVADINRGLRVSKLASSCAATTDVTLFNVVGDVALIGLVGKADGAMQAAATTILIKHTPTGGTATALSIASATLSAKAAGTMLTLPAAVSSALTISTGEGAALLNAAPVYALRPGALAMTVGAATNSQTVSWHLWYVPLSDGAYVEAA